LKNKYFYLFFVSNILIFLDQVTKFFVSSHIPLNHAFVVFPKFFAITHIRNPGVAFGLFADYDSDIKSLVFVGFSTVALGAILVFFHQAPRGRKLVHWGLILIFSGAIGNLIDRIVYKEVIDFLDIYIGGYHWPAFNIADSCITIGVVMMFYDLIKYDRLPNKPDPSEQTGTG